MVFYIKVAMVTIYQFLIQYQKSANITTVVQVGLEVAGLQL